MYAIAINGNPRKERNTELLLKHVLRTLPPHPKMNFILEIIFGMI